MLMGENMFLFQSIIWKMLPSGCSKSRSLHSYHYPRTWIIVCSVARCKYL